VGAIELSQSAAQLYEREFVPALFAQWPPQLCDAAEIAGGHRVLDAGCGTGVFAREAANRCGHASDVTGLDLNESMLAVAKSITPEIEWRVGDVLDLPFPDDAYDVVASQFVLMFVPDRVTALKEMWRVLAPGGRLAVAVWSDSPAYSALAEIAHRQGAEQVAASFEDPFDLGDQAKALGLFNDAGIPDVRLETRDGSVRFASIDEFIRVEIRGWILADALDEAAYEALLAEARHRLAEFCESDGRIVFPMNAHIITAHKS
jgi:SAM-dependent methyltransferase